MARLENTTGKKVNKTATLANTRVKMANMMVKTANRWGLLWGSLVMTDCTRGTWGSTLVMKVNTMVMMENSSVSTVMSHRIVDCSDCTWAT